MSTLYDREMNLRQRLHQLQRQLQRYHPDSYLLISVETGLVVIVPRANDSSGGHDTAFVQFAKQYGKTASYGLFLGCQL